MRIKKTSETRALAGTILNAQNSSTTDTYSCDYINENDSYSTNEIKTNQTWIDGKNIYRKLINISGNTSGTVNINIASLNIDKITFVDGYCYGNNGMIHGLYRVDENDEFRYFFMDKNTLVYKVGTNYPQSPYTGYFIIEYTKTTD